MSVASDARTITEIAEQVAGANVVRHHDVRLHAASASRRRRRRQRCFAVCIGEAATNYLHNILKIMEKLLNRVCEKIVFKIV